MFWKTISGLRIAPCVGWLRHRRCAFYRVARPVVSLVPRSTVAAMQAQRVAELADPKLPIPCRKVLTSLKEHWTGLTRFVDDPQIPLDNNASERRVRGPALGRKNYYGSGAIWSGRLASMLFSLFATLTLAKINIRT